MQLNSYFTTFGKRLEEAFNNPEGSTRNARRMQPANNSGKSDKP